MIPILHYPNINIHDQTLFYSNGIGRLSDCTRCICTEERNGIYEIEFDYPVNGQMFNQLLLGRIVACVPSQGKEIQPFIIYRRTASLDGVCTFNAYHYSYLLSYSVMMPHTYANIAEVVDAFNNASMTQTGMFEFQTDKSSVGSFEIVGLASIKSLLFGSEGSVLDVFGGGEYEYDLTDVYLYQNRGQDRGFTIRYGVNMLSLSDTLDGSELYGAVIPFWTDFSTNATIYANAVSPLSSEPWEASRIPPTLEDVVDENGNVIYFSTANSYAMPLDLSDQFENQPTTAQLQARASSWLAANQPWIPKRNIEVDFVFLSQTEEYANYKDLEDVRLCDTVHVFYDALGVVASAKVIKTDWNVLQDKYDSITIGQAVDDNRGYNGKVRIGSKTYKIVNGLITSIK